MDGYRLTSFLYPLLPQKPAKANVSLDAKAHARNAASHGTVEGSIPAFPVLMKASALKGAEQSALLSVSGKGIESL